MQFGRNRESRSREAAGRRNWPEAVPKKMRGKKRRATNSVGFRKAGKLAKTTIGRAGRCLASLT